jgi:hypothetical protein
MQNDLGEQEFTSHPLPRGRRHVCAAHVDLFGCATGESYVKDMAIAHDDAPHDRERELGRVVFVG